MTRARYLKVNGLMTIMQMIKLRRIKSKRSKSRYWENANVVIVMKMTPLKIFS